MTNRLEINWKLDGFVSDQNYYKSETPMNTSSMPVATTVLSGSTRSHIDTSGVLGKYYYIRISAIRNGVEKISDEKRVLFGLAWNPKNISSNKVWLDSSSYFKPNWNDKINNVINFTNSSNSPNLAGNSLLFADQYLTSSQQQLKDLFKNTSKLWFSITLKQNSKFNTEQSFFTVINNAVSSRFHLSVQPNTNQVVLMLRRLDSDTTYTKTILDQQINNIDSLIIQVDYDVGVIKYSVNGVYVEDSIPLSGGLISNTNSQYNISIGGWFTTAINNIVKNSNIYDIQIGSGNITSSDREKLEGWLARQYGTLDKLPSNHPYKTLIPTV